MVYFSAFISGAIYILKLMAKPPGTQEPLPDAVPTRSAGITPAAALTASKACIAAACQPGRGGYTDELEFTRSLLTNPETQKRVTAFLAGATESSTQSKSGAAR